MRGEARRVPDVASFTSLVFGIVTENISEEPTPSLAATEGAALLMGAPAFLSTSRGLPRSTCSQARRHARSVRHSASASGERAAARQPVRQAAHQCISAAAALTAQVTPRPGGGGGLGPRPGQPFSDRSATSQPVHMPAQKWQGCLSSRAGWMRRISSSPQAHVHRQKSLPKKGGLAARAREARGLGARRWGGEGALGAHGVCTQRACCPGKA